MIDLFYQLPIWLATTLVLGIALILGLGVSSGIHRLFRLTSSDDEIEIAVNLMQVVAAYIGILLAFAGVQVWQDFADAQNAVHREATSASELYRDLATYGPEAKLSRLELRRYVTSVTNDEWHLLADGRSSKATDTALARLYVRIGQIKPVDARESTIYSQAFTNLSELVAFRRDRLILSRSGMPPILWIVGLFGSMLIVVYTATFPRTRTNLFMIGGISIALGLVFLFILVVDRPYMGAFSVQNDEIVRLSAKFDELDRLTLSLNSEVESGLTKLAPTDSAP